MIDALSNLRHRARMLQRAAHEGNTQALQRLRRLQELSGVTASDAARRVKRRHCLATLARECGFSGWSHLTSVVEGAAGGDFGTLLHRKECFAHWNIWSASYEEARQIRNEHGGYLLPYRRQFMIVDRHYLETLGLDPDDPDLEAIGRDWVRPGDAEARKRLYARLIAAREA